MTELGEVNRKLDHVCEKVNSIDTALRGDGNENLGIVARVVMVEKEQKRFRLDMDKIKKIPGKVLWICGGCLAAALFSWIKR